MNENEAPDADGLQSGQASGAHDASSDFFTADADDETAPIAAAPAGGSPRGYSRAKRIIGFGAAAVVLLGVGAGGGALAVEGLQSSHATAATGTTNGLGQGPNGSSPGGTGGGFGPNGTPFGGFRPHGGLRHGGFGSGGLGSGGSGSGSAPQTPATTGTPATAAQQAGVVTVLSSLGYQSGEAAGTGLILTSNGEILTNNHVIEGSTSITVTVASTGRTYTASVVGDNPTKDVAVLQLKGASGLTTAKIASTAATVGDPVTAIGNAGGTGTLSVASGSVTALNRSITTQAEASAASESLTGLIETNAGIVAGDSGGPLENSSGQVVGIDTAASSGTASVTGFAIPISTAVKIAGEITSGSTSGGITLGLPAFLGVEVSADPTVPGAGVAQVLPNTPAQAAGLAAGDVITAVNGRTIGSASALSTVLRSYSPGTSVSLTYTDSTGSSQTVHVTLISGPAN